MALFVFRLATLYFLAIFAAGFVLGTLRVLLVAPVLGELPAVLLELPLMLIISWFVCRAVTARLPVGNGVGARLAMGAMAFALLMGAEFLLGLYGFGRSLSEIVAAYGEAAGFVGLLGQLGFALIPLLQRPRGAQA